MTHQLRARGPCLPLGLSILGSSFGFSRPLIVFLLTFRLQGISER